MRPSPSLVTEVCRALNKKKSSLLPRYKDLYEILRQQIVDGLLLPGMCLPSSRVLAQQLKLSRNTVIAALDQLCAEGYAEARPQSGIYILPTHSEQWQFKKVISKKSQPLLSQRGETLSQQSKTI